MALHKDFATQFGVTGNYWKITDVSLQIGFTIFHISCYVDQTARLADAEPLISKEICIDGGIPVKNMQLVNSDPYALCYDAIKAHTIRADVNSATFDADGNIKMWFFDDATDI